jgi:adenylate cyclase 1
MRNVAQKMSSKKCFHLHFHSCLSFQLLNEDRFQGVDKIKTIGSTFMAAVGLTPDKVIQDTDESVLQSMTVLVEFILAMKQRLNIINENSYNNFMLRIGR